MFFTRGLAYIYRKWYYWTNKSKFKYLAPNAIILKYLRLDGKSNISIGERVIVQRMTWLAAVPLTGSSECSLKIGAGSVIGNFNHIYATGRITIGEQVLTADKVYISDNMHGYQNPDLPVMAQPVQQLRPVTIGDGSWLGENVCVIGASIGCHCVIGANSVVTHDIPDYSVAVGVPAKIIKKYNHKTKQWEKQ